ncbi:hypothetical protein CEP54_007004 [Fusarium duplospermum]|uniref:Uncharacterized protein n=1 Tax=Fusarium duplospermum TaxID=1325734 RepID=A0A428Q459_9HYPO|nr:hypothetical protein CEP54_007004 [Fusarium duplospermum]
MDAPSSQAFGVNGRDRQSSRRAVAAAAAAAVAVASAAGSGANVAHPLLRSRGRVAATIRSQSPSNPSVPQPVIPIRPRN